MWVVASVAALTAGAGLAAAPAHALTDARSGDTSFGDTSFGDTSFGETVYDLRVIVVSPERRAYFARNQSTAAACLVDIHDTSDSAPATARVSCGADAFAEFSDWREAHDADTAPAALTTPLHDDGSMDGARADSAGEATSFAARLLGFGFSISAQDGGDHDHTAILIHTPDGKSFVVDADDGPHSERARVTIDNASADDAREFIADIDELKSAERRQMKAELGL